MKLLKQENGAILILSLIVMIVLVGMAIQSMNNILSERQSNQNFNAKSATQKLAASVLSYAFNRLNDTFKDPTTGPCLTTFNSKTSSCAPGLTNTAFCIHAQNTPTNLSDPNWWQAGATGATAFSVNDPHYSAYYYIQILNSGSSTDSQRLVVYAQAMHNTLKIQTVVSSIYQIAYDANC